MTLTRRQPRPIVAVIALAAPIFAIAPPAAAAPAPGTIVTIAGGVGGPGKGPAVPLAAGNDNVCGVSFAAGAMYVGDTSTLRRVTLHTGWLTTPVLAGAAHFVEAGDGGAAVDASGQACNVTTDHAGNLVFGDPFNDHVRVVAAQTGTFYGQAMTAGDIYSVAGNGMRGFSGDRGPATKAEFYSPGDVIVDQAGNLVITDTFNGRIRVVAAQTGTFYGQAMTAGDIYTIAGNGTRGYTGDGIPATTAGMESADSVALDAGGNLVILDGGDQRLRLVAEHTGTLYGQAMTAGDIYTIAGNGVAGFAGDGGPATSAEVSDPQGMAPDAAGNLLIADTGNNRIRVLAARTGTFYGRAMTRGDIYTVAGNGTAGFAGNRGPALRAEFSRPGGVAVDSTGNLLIADDGNARVRVVAATAGTFYGVDMTAGDVYTAAGTGLAGNGDNGPALRAQFGIPLTVAVDAAANVLIADGSRIRVVPPRAGTFYGRAMTAGDIYTIAGIDRVGFSGDGGPATKAALDDPTGIALDAAGNVLITCGVRLRVIAGKTGRFYGQAMTAGDIYTIAGSGRIGYAGDGGPALGSKMLTIADVALDGAGNVLIADGSRIRVVPVHTGTFYGQAMTARDIYTIAGQAGSGGGGFSGDGGPAIQAKIWVPGGLTVDGVGNVVIADSMNSRIRVVAAKTGTFYGQAMTAGDIYTIAGNGTAGYTGDGGAATAAEFNLPLAVVLDSNGNLVVGDTFNSAIRVVPVRTGTFYGRPMTAGHVYTVSGTGSPGFSGDGGPAARASLDEPRGLAADGPGSLVIADTNNVRIRFVAGG